MQEENYIGRCDVIWYPNNVVANFAKEGYRCNTKQKNPAIGCDFIAKSYV